MVIAPHMQHEIEAVVKLQKVQVRSARARAPGSVPADNGKARARGSMYAGFAASRAH